MFISWCPGQEIMRPKPFLFSFTKFYPGELRLILVRLFLIYRRRGRCCFPVPDGIFLTVHSMASLWNNGEMGDNYWLYGETSVAIDFELVGRYHGDLIFTSDDPLYATLFATIFIHLLLPIGNCHSDWLQHKSNPILQHGLGSLAMMSQMLL